MGKYFTDPTWNTWKDVLRVYDGLPPRNPELMKELFNYETLPDFPGSELVAICGRRGGKSQVAAALGTSCLMAAPRPKLGGVLTGGIIGRDKSQAQLIMKYAQSLIAKRAPGLVVRRSQETLGLKGDRELKVLHANQAAVRGYTFTSFTGDEVAFWSSKTESANLDTEIVSAAIPALTTTHGPMMLLSSPWSEVGLLYERYTEYYGVVGAKRVFQAPTWIMNPNITPDDPLLKDVRESDEIAFDTEYGANFRKDAESYLTVGIDESQEDRAPYNGQFCEAFVDAASGSGKDSIALATGYQCGSFVNVDTILHESPPFDADKVIEKWAEGLHKRGIRRVWGDNYAGDIHQRMWKKRGINYRISPPKGVLYNDAAPSFNALRVRLPRQASETPGESETAKIVLRQLRRLKDFSCGRGMPRIDHPRGEHDDLANAACGVIAILEKHYKTPKQSGSSLYR